VDIHVKKAPAYILAAKLILAAAGPAQKLIQTPSPTHSMCNRQAKVILFNDGFKHYAEIVDEFGQSLDRGVAWADEGFKNMSHFYCPRTSKGLPGWTDAQRECQLYWKKAVLHWQNCKYVKAFFYLGAAAHLVQDLCVPHHAMGILLDGHQEYEEWAAVNRERYKVENGGIYMTAQNSGNWLRSNAVSASRNYHLVRKGSTEEKYNLATSVLLPRAQRATAGMLHYFLQKTRV